MSIKSTTNLLHFIVGTKNCIVVRDNISKIKSCGTPSPRDFQDIIAGKKKKTAIFQNQNRKSVTKNQNCNRKE